MARATRKDVATLSGVSETVVSYVLNNNRYVDGEKRSRVIAAVKELGYAPSPMARALKGKGNGQLLLIADDIKSEHFGYLVGELEKRAYPLGLMVSLCQYHPEKPFLEHILSHSYSGFLVASGMMPHEDVQYLIDENKNVVVMEIKDTPPFHGLNCSINTGLFQGEGELLSLLEKRGRKHIAFVSPPSLALSSEDWRLKAYLEKEKEPFIISGENEADLGGKIAHAWKSEGIDGFCCRCDYCGCIAIKYLKEAGAKVGEDVSVTGFDDTFCSSYITPGLTTARICRDKIAEAAISFFAQQKKGKSFMHIDIPSLIVKRGSV